MPQTVLVVDDDEGVRLALAAVLEEEGYDVDLAADGLEALERLQAKRPSLILLDLMMPRMDGYAFTEELQRRGLRPALPLMVLTADARAKNRALQLGVDGFIAKPFDISDLVDQVARLAAL